MPLFKIWHRKKDADSQSVTSSIRRSSMTTATSDRDHVSEVSREGTNSSGILAATAPFLNSRALSNFTTLSSSNGIHVSTAISNPIIYLKSGSSDTDPATQILDPSSATTALQGCAPLDIAMILTIEKQTVLKTITTSLDCVACVQWPDGFPPLKQDHEEKFSIARESWNVLAHDSTDLSPDAYIPLNSNGPTVLANNGGIKTKLLEQLDYEDDVWSDSTSPNSPLSLSLSRAISHMVDDKDKNDNNNNNIKKIYEPGHYIFIFPILIPHSMPESILAPHAGLGYFFHINITRPLAPKLGLSSLTKSINVKKQIMVVRSPPSIADSLINHPIYINRVWANALSYEITFPLKFIPLGSDFELRMKLTPLDKGVAVHRIKIIIVERAEYSSKDLRYEWEDGIKKYTNKQAERKVVIYDKKAASKEKLRNLQLINNGKDGSGDEEQRRMTAYNIMSPSMHTNVIQKSQNKKKKPLELEYDKQHDSLLLNKQSSFENSENEIIISEPTTLVCKLPFVAAEPRNINNINTTNNDNNNQSSQDLDNSEFGSWSSNPFNHFSPVLAPTVPVLPFAAPVQDPFKRRSSSRENENDPMSLFPDSSNCKYIRVSHRLQISFRISKKDNSITPEEISKKVRHYEVIVDTPIHLLSRYCKGGNVELPLYSPNPTPSSPSAFANCNSPMSFNNNYYQQTNDDLNSNYNLVRISSNPNDALFRSNTISSYTSDFSLDSPNPYQLNHYGNSFGIGEDVPPSFQEALSTPPFIPQSQSQSHLLRKTITNRGAFDDVQSLNLSQSVTNSTNDDNELYSLQNSHENNNRNVSGNGNGNLFRNINSFLDLPNTPISTLSNNNSSTDGVDPMDPLHDLPDRNGDTQTPNSPVLTCSDSAISINFNGSSLNESNLIENNTCIPASNLTNRLKTFDFSKNNDINNNNNKNTNTNKTNAKNNDNYNQDENDISELNLKGLKRFVSLTSSPASASSAFNQIQPISISQHGQSYNTSSNSLLTRGSPSRFNNGKNIYNCDLKSTSAVGLSNSPSTSININLNSSPGIGFEGSYNKGRGMSIDSVFDGSFQRQSRQNSNDISSNSLGKVLLPPNYDAVLQEMKNERESSRRKSTLGNVCINNNDNDIIDNRVNNRLEPRSGSTYINSFRNTSSTLPITGVSGLKRTTTNSNVNDGEAVNHVDSQLGIGLQDIESIDAIQYRTLFN